jgi:hypothetical protein
MVGQRKTGDGSAAMRDGNHYDRERQALYLTGLLPLEDVKEAQATLALCSRLLPILIESREARVNVETEQAAAE